MGGVGSGRREIVRTKAEIRKRNRESKRKQRENGAIREIETAYSKLWRAKNKDKVSKTLKDYRQRVKVKKLKKYYSGLKYERKNPGRKNKDYYANKEKYIQANREYRQRMKKAA